MHVETSPRAARCVRLTEEISFFFSVAMLAQAILAQAVVVQTAARSAGVASLEILHS